MANARRLWQKLKRVLRFLEAVCKAEDYGEAPMRF